MDKKKLDGRSLSRNTMEELRIRAVCRVLEGESPEVVIRAIGMHRTRIYKWIAAYREGGFDALKGHPSAGAVPLLSEEQKAELLRIITEEDPRDYGREVALWTLSIVRELISSRFDVLYSEVHTGRLLKKLGLSRQKPLLRAYEQDPRAVEEFLSVTYPEIKQEAKRAGADIYFLDEAAVESAYYKGTTWAKKGSRPVIASSGSRFRLNMISALCSTGLLRFALYENRFTQATLIGFLKRLRAGSDRPLFVIADGHPVHRGTAVREYVESTTGAVRLYILPGYSPELNVDEKVWAYVKPRLGKIPRFNIEDLRHDMRAALHHLQKLPEIVKSFFHAPDCRYTLVDVKPILG